MIWSHALNNCDFLGPRPEVVSPVTESLTKTVYAENVSDQHDQNSEQSIQHFHHNNWHVSSCRYATTTVVVSLNLIAILALSGEC